MLNIVRNVLDNPSADDVFTWMQNLKWTFMTCPSLGVVKSILASASAMLLNQDVMFIWDESRCKFGRDSFFDYHTKIATCVKLCGNNANPSSLVYVVRRIYVQMLRLKNNNPYSDRDLSGYGGTINYMLWQRSYFGEADEISS